MVLSAIVIGGIIGGALVVFGTLLVRGALGIRTPRALDPEYRHREVISCGEIMAIGMKAGSIGAGAGAVVGLLVYELFL